MGGAETLIAIARILTTEPDLTEVPRAQAHAARPDLTRVPVDEPGFRDSVFASAAVTRSDDVPYDLRFAFEQFHRFPHFPRRSGLIVPIHVDRDVAGAFYLVWWQRAERPDDVRIATLEAVGQQVALLLPIAWLLREAERQRAEALAAEPRYRGLVEPVPVGIYRTTLSGRMVVDVNSAMVEILRFHDREALLGINAASLYVTIRRTASAATASATPAGSRETSGRSSAPATAEPCGCG